MSQLFGKKTKRKRPAEQAEENTTEIVLTTSAPVTNDDNYDPEAVRTFEELGLTDWIQSTCSTMGFKRPTPVQRNCIPPILKGQDVIACALTGSGKTAAFALPILHSLSQDPYGIYAIVLTPTRELAYQISEQFRALGAPMGLRDAIVIGGMDMLKQSLELEQRPHVVVATPGRLADHISRSARPPALSRVAVLVLDEADRLLEQCFSENLETVLGALPPPRVGGKPGYQTLLFSATITQDQDLSVVPSLKLHNTFRYSSVPRATTVQGLIQQYLFMPAQVKTCYLAYLLRFLGPPIEGEGEEDDPLRGALGLGSANQELASASAQELRRKEKAKLKARAKARQQQGGGEDKDEEDGGGGVGRWLWRGRRKGGRAL